MPNSVHFVEVAIPAGVLVKVLGEYSAASGGKLQLTSESPVSLAAAKTAVGTLGSNVTAAAA